MVVQDAIVQAIEAYRMPSRHRRLARHLLPHGMLNVIKAAAGDEAVLEQAAAEFQMTREEVREACKHYLLKLLLDPSVRDLQILGLNADASAAEVKDHKRWLLKWLHPDRNPSAWEQALFHKIAQVKDVEGGIPQSLAKPLVVRPSHGQRPSQGKRPRLATQKPKVESSPWAVGFRMMRPLIASVILAAALIWFSGSVLRDSPGSFEWLDAWAKP